MEKEKQVKIPTEREKRYELAQRLKVLLEAPAEEVEKERLKEAGLPPRYRDRLQLVAYNLYQKALAGDLAAIRELRGLLAEAEGRGKDGKGPAGPVVIIDDLR